MSPPVLAAIAWAVVLGFGGALMTPIEAWYSGLRKPAWQPPDWLFGPAWTIILALAAWAGVIAWHAARSADDQRTILIVFLVNGLCHFAWSPLFFRLRRPDWALVEVVFLWTSLVAMIVGLWPISQMAALMILPYLAWVSFAAALNRAIVRLNPSFGGR
ncbi:MAG: TspO/MBR family protein [Sphingomonas sp.]